MEHIQVTIKSDWVRAEDRNDIVKISCGDEVLIIDPKQMLDPQERLHVMGLFLWQVLKLGVCE